MLNGYDIFTFGQAFDSFKIPSYSEAIAEVSKYKVNFNLHYVRNDWDFKGRDRAYKDTVLRFSDRRHSLQGEARKHFSIPNGTPVIADFHELALKSQTFEEVYLALVEASTVRRGQSSLLDFLAFTFVDTMLQIFSKPEIICDAHVHTSARKFKHLPYHLFLENENNYANLIESFTFYFLRGYFMMLAHSARGILAEKVIFNKLSKLTDSFNYATGKSVHLSWGSASDEAREVDAFMECNGRRLIELQLKTGGGLSDAYMNSYFNRCLSYNQKPTPVFVGCTFDAKADLIFRGRALTPVNGNFYKTITSQMFFDEVYRLVLLSED